MSKFSDMQHLRGRLGKALSQFSEGILHSILGQNSYSILWQLSFLNSQRVLFTQFLDSTLLDSRTAILLHSQKARFINSRIALFTQSSDSTLYSILGKHSASFNLPCFPELQDPVYKDHNFTTYLP